MAKFLYSAAMSLDGFITGPGGDMSWLAEHIGPNPVVDELITQVGAILAGRRTYGGDDPYKGQPGEGEVDVGQDVPRATFTATGTAASSRAASGGNAGVGPFHCNWSTLSNSAMSVRSVARSRKRNA